MQLSIQTPSIVTHTREIIYVNWLLGLEKLFLCWFWGYDIGVLKDVTPCSLLEVTDVSEERPTLSSCRRVTRENNQAEEGRGELPY
jgi:hypothetical protein